MKVFAAVGTQRFPFNRLIEALDDIVRVRDFDAFVQYGNSKPPAVCKGSAFLGNEEYIAMLKCADVVVVHGGVGTIRTALSFGARVIAVPRCADMGEHVDNHQNEIVAAFAKGGYILPCYDTLRLAAVIDDAMKLDFPRFNAGICTIEEELSDLAVQWGFKPFIDTRKK